MRRGGGRDKRRERESMRLFPSHVYGPGRGTREGDFFLITWSQTERGREGKRGRNNTPLPTRKKKEGKCLIRKPTPEGGRGREI